MNKITYILLSFILLATFNSCSDDDWTTDPALEHIYYVGFYKTGAFSDKLNYEIAADGTSKWRINTGQWQETGKNGTSSDIPIQLHSERVRSYNATTFVWITNANEKSTLVAGTDYILVDKEDKAIALSDNKYALTWPQTKKGVQVLKIKRLTQKVGSLKVNTLPKQPIITEEEYAATTLNSKDTEYEVRGLSHDYNTVTVSLN